MKNKDAMELPRPVLMLNQLTKQFPNTWETVEGFRKDKKELGDWPDWCFIPISALFAITQNTELAIEEQIVAAYQLTALASWRMTKGIYRFDPAVYAALLDSTLEGDLPSDIFFKLPEWCLYLETPHFEIESQTIHGAFVHLEYDVNHHHTELRILLDTDSDPLPLILYLGPWSITTAIEKALNVASRNAAQASIDLPLQSLQKADPNILKVCNSVISLLLYILTQTSEIQGKTGTTPQNPKATKTKKGIKTFAAKQVNDWNVGVRMGQLIRSGNSNDTDYSSHDSGRTVRPHIRRAHWHSFWTGPKKEGQVKSIKWIPPLMVADNQTELVPVIRPIK